MIEAEDRKCAIDAYVREKTAGKIVGTKIKYVGKGDDIQFPLQAGPRYRASRAA